MDGKIQKIQCNSPKNEFHSGVDDLCFKHFEDICFLNRFAYDDLKCLNT